MITNQPEALRLVEQLEFLTKTNGGMVSVFISCGRLREAAAELRRLHEVETKYYELLYAVAVKWDGESRHQTALRYIRNAESTTGNSIAQTTGEQYAN